MEYRTIEVICPRCGDIRTYNILTYADFDSLCAECWILFKYGPTRLQSERTPEYLLYQKLRDSRNFELVRKLIEDWAKCT